MSDMINEINRHAAEAQAQKTREEEAAEAALAEYRERQEKTRIRRRRRATRGLVLRATLALVVALALLAVQKAGLIDFRLVLILLGMLASWVCIWIGGWAQFMFAEGGLFRWRN